jgi:hypothetical protein
MALRLNRGKGTAMILRSVNAILLAISFSALSYAGPAMAQDGPPTCADGSDGSNGCHAQVVYSEPAPSPGGRYVVAWRKDSNNGWIAINYSDVKKASAAAKAACNAAMGGGCKFGSWGQHQSVLIYRYPGGLVESVVANTLEDAERMMQNNCQKANRTCAIINSGDSHGQTEPMIIAPQGNPRSAYAAAARPSKDPTGQASVVIATGYTIAKDAEQAALQACREKNKITCKIAASIADNFILVGIDEKKGAWVSFSLTKEIDPERVKEHCDPKSAFCKVTSAFSANDKGVQIFDAYGATQD